MQDNVQHLDDLATLAQPKVRLDGSNKNEKRRVRFALRSATRTLNIRPQFHPVVETRSRMPRACRQASQRRNKVDCRLRNEKNKVFTMARFSTGTNRYAGGPSTYGNFGRNRKPYQYRSDDVARRQREGWRRYGQGTSRNVLDWDRNEESYRTDMKWVDVPREHVRPAYGKYRKVRYPVRFSTA